MTSNATFWHDARWFTFVTRWPTLGIFNNAQLGGYNNLNNSGIPIAASAPSPWANPLPESCRKVARLASQPVTVCELQ
jgi:hypothetical protein